ncbi:MAG: hydroxymethylbilane synthase [Planctomycetota bacterium]|jgi:hydroxymethylbilane synthase
MRRLVIGTRGSKLALWQAEHVREALRAAWGELAVSVETIRTAGDRAAGQGPPPAPGDGLFTRTIENALLAGEVDLAVHSLKDLPTELPEGLTVAAVPAREDPADALVAKNGADLTSLPPGAEALTGSPRRRAQLLRRRPDLKVSPVRGNVQTRLGKLDESDAHAIVLARAGLVRLGLADRITERLDPTDFVPACGQGALAVEIRGDDEEVLDIVCAIEDAEARAAVTAERAFLAALGGGCRVPVAGYGRPADDGASLALTGIVSSPDGSRLLRGTLNAPLSDVEAARRLGERLAEELLAEGAREILEAES